MNSVIYFAYAVGLIAFSLLNVNPKNKSNCVEREVNAKSLLDTTSKPFPQSKGYVNDFYSLFSDKEVQLLDSLIKSYEQKATVEICVVTLDSTYTIKENFDEYTLELAKRWGVGKKEINNGIVIAICPDYRRVRIHNGFGIEDKITDQETKQILDTVILPLFKKGMFYEGVWKGIQALIFELNKKE